MTAPSHRVKNAEEAVAGAEIGNENLFGNRDDALNRARVLVSVAEEPGPSGATPTVEREKIG